MKTNYRKEIEKLLNNNGLIIKQFSIWGTNYKTLYYGKKSTSNCEALQGKNYRDILLKLFLKFNK